MKVPIHIYWSAKGPVEVDLADPTQKRWWVRQVLTHGTMADVCSLDLRDIEEFLPDLHLPGPVRALWRDYFARRDIGPLPSEDT